jgi:hypothetical protein
VITRTITVVLSVLVLISAGASHGGATSSLTPCGLLKQMYPPTRAAFDQTHLSVKERAEVLKWTAKFPKNDVDRKVLSCGDIKVSP